MTTLGFLHNLAKESKGLSLDITTQWHKLNDRQRTNIHKSISDMAYVIALGITAGCLYNYASRRKNNPWLLKFAEYQAVKLYADHVVFLPGIGITNWKAAFGEPISALGTLSDFGKLPEALNYQNWRRPCRRIVGRTLKGIERLCTGYNVHEAMAVTAEIPESGSFNRIHTQNNNTFGAVEKTKETKEIAKREKGWLRKSKRYKSQARRRKKRRNRKRARNNLTY